MILAERGATSLSGPISKVAWLTVIQYILFAFAGCMHPLATSCRDNMAPSKLLQAAPLPLAVFASLLVGFLSASRRRSRERQRQQLHVKRSCHLLILPRLVLLQALADTCHKLPAAIGAVEWSPFCELFVKALQTVVQEVVRESAELENWLRRVSSREEMLDDLDLLQESRNAEQVVVLFSQAIDDHVVSFLQTTPRVASLVQGYLPQRGQSWLEFLDLTLADAEEREMAGLAGDLRPQNSLNLLNVQDVAAGLLLLKEIEARCNSIKVAVPKRGGRMKITHIPPPTQYKQETVFYATDRKVTEDCEYMGDRRDMKSFAASSYLLEALHYGSVIVGIPAVHVPGQIEGPASRGEESDPLSHVVILSVDATMQSSSTQFIQKLNWNIAQHEAQGGITDVLLYIHGYNVHFSDAMRRAAQLKYDLKLSGAIISYSWSSRGRIYGYKHDETTVRETVPCLATFINLCITQVKARKVHILAHSMGNRALIGALKKLYCDKADVQSISRGLRWPLKNVILAAADEKRSRFEEMVKLAKTNFSEVRTQQQHADIMKPHFSVYCSREDIALLASRMVHTAGAQARLGDIRSHLESGARTLVDSFVDVIDATGIDVKQLHHSYYGDVPIVLQDIKQLIASSGDANLQPREEWPAAIRAHHTMTEGAIKKVTYKERQFFAFSPAHWGG